MDVPTEFWFVKTPYLLYNYLVVLMDLSNGRYFGRVPVRILTRIQINAFDGSQVGWSASFIPVLISIHLLVNCDIVVWDDPQCFQCSMHLLCFTLSSTFPCILHIRMLRLLKAFIVSGNIYNCLLSIHWCSAVGLKQKENKFVESVRFWIEISQMKITL